MSNGTYYVSFTVQSLLQTLNILILKKEPNKVGDTDEDIEARRATL